MNRGIDYGMGKTNIDRKTGIRYGIVSANEMGEGFFDSIENEYDNACPKCGNDLSDEQMDELESKLERRPSKWFPEHGAWEAPCPHCEEFISVDDTTGDEPSRSVFDVDGCKGFLDSNNDVWVIESPFYVHGVFCSPCAPGAVSIGERCGNDDEDGPRAYALPDDWYASGKAPGKLHKVNDDEGKEVA